MEEADHRLLIGFSSGLLPSMVSLSPFSPVPPSSSRRLSSHFTPNYPLPSARRLAWVSLQGRVVNAEEASSATAIGGSFSREETLAWELFTPFQRFLIVAVIGVAVVESKKNKLISQLKKSVNLRDEVLSSMQQKLDDLCEQLSSTKNQTGSQPNTSLYNNVESPANDNFGCDKIKFIDCGCWHCDHHQDLFAGLMGNTAPKVSRGDEVLQYKMPLVDQAEQEERRMSDLSDWASSVTSSADIQMNMSVLDQDIFNLKKECEEKDATIEELTTIIQSTSMADSKRNAELEDIIRRKNSTILKLKKELAVMEQKLVYFTRLQRPSFSSSALCNSGSRKVPLMLENIVYDMDSNTSASSSSDSDSSPKNRPVLIPVAKSPVASSPPSSNSDHSSPNQRDVDSVQIQETPLQNTTELATRRKQKIAPPKGSSSKERLRAAQNTESRPATPLQEKSINLKSGTVSSLRPKQLSVSGDFKKIRRRTQTSVTSPKKKWS
ncbi:uncharacterized protein [Euphorbia lathyris]|uniref:uncharacterized protein n=1 Tax=Euphorbia lathyris TaxID=212925 RepID=UPI003313FF06